MSDEHTMTATDTPDPVTVMVNGVLVARTERAKTVSEHVRGSDLPPVHYVPREDAHMHLFEPTSRKTHCPIKGEARYWTIEAMGKRAENAVWSYEAPVPLAAAITGYLAFDPKQAQIIVGDERAAQEI